MTEQASRDKERASEPSAEEWDASVLAERARQATKGYDAAHDREHGVTHLLVWAIDYARRGKALKAAALVLAARELIENPEPEITEEVVERLPGEEEPIARNQVLRGVDLAVERLVRADAFTERTRRILDELRADVLGVATPDEVRSHYRTSAGEAADSNPDPGPYTEADHAKYEELRKETLR